ncbi:MAG: hypothetical protein WDM90_05695 [Ferruginibacter sp.]
MFYEHFHGETSHGIVHRIKRDGRIGSAVIIVGEDIGHEKKLNH